MTPRGYILAAVAFCAAAVLAWKLSPHTVYAETRLQSAFFRGYDPNPLLDTWRRNCTQGFSGAATSSASAGERSFRSSRNVRFSRSIQSEVCDGRETAPILNELYGQLRAALESAQCRYTPNDPSAGDRGFRLHYLCGERTSGVVSVAPPERIKDRRRDVLRFALQIDEQWFVARL